MKTYDTSLFDALHALVGASRRSSEAVLDTLEERLVALEPLLDVLLVFVPDGEELRCVAARGRRSEYFTALRLRRDDPVALPARAALAGHRAFAREDLVIPTDRAALAVPLLDDRALRAVIYVASRFSESFDAEEAIVRTIESAAIPYALALEREADRADATYDGLTGLLTPRAFRVRLGEEIERRRRYDASVASLWFIDTDHFKTINDTYGHAVGDTVLQGMAALLRAATVSGVDVAGRNGGDEFCALILDAQKTVAIERAQALRDAVRRHDFGVAVPVGASIGVATFPYDAQDSYTLLECADAAMYHSKRNGRDCVSFALDGAAFAVFR